MDSEDTKYMFGLKKYKTNGKHDNHISFFAKNVSEDGTYTTQKTFYAPFPMTFRLWIEKKVFEKWWYKKLADWSMNIYNRNLRINRKERERVGKLIRY